MTASIIVAVLSRIVAHFPSQMEGNASWMGRECDGKIMADGTKFDHVRYTGASWFFPLGTEVIVSNPITGRTVRIKITDRGPAWRLVRKKNRIIDLSWIAFIKIGDPTKGVVEVVVTVAQPVPVMQHSLSL